MRGLAVTVSAFVMGLVGSVEAAKRPAISVEGGVVLFRNARDKVVKKIPLLSETGGEANVGVDAAFLSPGRNYVGVVTYPSEACTDQPGARVVFYSASGKTLWKENGLSEVDPVRFSENGNRVLLVLRTDGPRPGVRAVLREMETAKTLFFSQVHGQIHEVRLSEKGYYGRFHARDTGFQQRQVIFGVKSGKEKVLDLEEEVYVLPSDDGVFRYFYFKRGSEPVPGLAYTVEEIRLD